MKVRVHSPEHGWGTVTSIHPQPAAILFPGRGFPSHLVHVEWDLGGYGRVDPMTLHVENGASLRPLLN